MLARAPANRRLNLPFHGEALLIATSRNPRAFGVTVASCVASYSLPPPGDSLRRSVSSTCWRGKRRMRSLRMSCGTARGVGLGRGPGGRLAVLVAVVEGFSSSSGSYSSMVIRRGGNPTGCGGSGWPEAVACAVAMASKINRTERTTLSWTTPRHKARSSRKACWGGCLRAACGWRV